MCYWDSYKIVGQFNIIDLFNLKNSVNMQYAREEICSLEKMVAIDEINRNINMLLLNK